MFELFHLNFGNSLIMFTELNWRGSHLIVPTQLRGVLFIACFTLYKIFSDFWSHLWPNVLLFKITKVSFNQNTLLKDDHDFLRQSLYVSIRVLRFLTSSDSSIFHCSCHDVYIKHFLSYITMETFKDLIALHVTYFGNNYHVKKIYHKIYWVHLEQLILYHFIIELTQKNPWKVK